MRLIDADALKDKVLKWMPSDPCGIAEKEYPIETDIVVSLIMEIDQAPTIDAVEVVRGEWEERETFHNADDNPIIEEWQSARCSECGKYHTTPYMYYFDEYNFCPNCGAKMDGERKESE